MKHPVYIRKERNFWVVRYRWHRAGRKIVAKFNCTNVLHRRVVAWINERADIELGSMKTTK